MNQTISSIDDLNDFYASWYAAREPKIARALSNPQIAKLAYKREVEKVRFTSMATNDADRIMRLRQQKTYEASLLEVAEELDEVASHFLQIGATTGPDSTSIGHSSPLDLLEQTVRQAKRFGAAQKARAKKPRGKIDGEVTMAEIVKKLAIAPDHRETSAKQLWPLFISDLGDRRLDPEEVASTTGSRKSACKYNYADRRRSIAFSSFQNLVSKARRKKSQQPG